MGGSQPPPVCRRAAGFQKIPGTIWDALTVAGKGELKRLGSSVWGPAGCGMWDAGLPGADWLRVLERPDKAALEKIQVQPELF